MVLFAAYYEMYIPSSNLNTKITNVKDNKNSKEFLGNIWMYRIVCGQSSKPVTNISYIIYNGDLKKHYISLSFWKSPSISIMQIICQKSF